MDPMSFQKNTSRSRCQYQKEQQKQHHDTIRFLGSYILQCILMICFIAIALQVVVVVMNFQVHAFVTVPLYTKPPIEILNQRRYDGIDNKRMISQGASQNSKRRISPLFSIEEKNDHVPDHVHLLHKTMAVTDDDDISNDCVETNEMKDNNHHNTRRQFLSTTTSSLLLTTGFVCTQQPTLANAFDRTYPTELQYDDGNKNSNGDSRVRKINQIVQNENEQAKEMAFYTNNKLLSTSLWGTTLWFLSGSRSNPFATPLGNFIYKKEQEVWLQERNDGYFAKLPWEFLIILGILYLSFGYILDSFVVLVTSSASSTAGTAITPPIINVPDIIKSITTTTTIPSIQLACVTLIGSLSLELGRIASGEKQLTKNENQRLQLLQNEFLIFAQERLVVTNSINNNNKNNNMKLDVTTTDSSTTTPSLQTPAILPKKRSSSNVHRNEVVNAFRRYYAKYRTRPDLSTLSNNMGDNSNSNNTNNMVLVVTDLEIEKLLRTWASQNGIDMTSAGFYKGIQINLDADAFR